MRRSDAVSTRKAVGLGRAAWTLLALVLLTLVLAQACGQGGSRSGPSQSAGVGLKVRRSAGQLPAGCTGTLFVTGPGVNLQVSIPSSGQLSLQLPVGVSLALTVVLDCGALGTHVGSATLTVDPAGTDVTIVVVATTAGVSCSPSTVGPDQVANCVCTVKSPSANQSVTWTGPVSPGSGTTTTFSSPNPGTYAVTCTVNNVASASTTVTVTSSATPGAPGSPGPPAPPGPPGPPPPPPSQDTGVIEVTNADSAFALTAQFSAAPPGQASVPPLTGLAPGQKGSRTVPVGSYVLSFSFDIGGSRPCGAQTVNVAKGQTVPVSRNADSCRPVASVACVPSTVAINDPSTCTCNVTNGPPNTSITWEGSVFPPIGTTTTFRSSVAGPHTVTCKLETFASASTTVQVEAPTIIEQ